MVLQYYTTLRKRYRCLIRAAYSYLPDPEINLTPYWPRRQNQAYSCLINIQPRTDLILFRTSYNPHVHTTTFQSAALILCIHSQSGTSYPPRYFPPKSLTPALSRLFPVPLASMTFPHFPFPFSLLPCLDKFRTITPTPRGQTCVSASAW
jgi:hypothetical protein